MFSKAAAGCVPYKFCESLTSCSCKSSVLAFWAAGVSLIGRSSYWAPEAALSYTGTSLASILSFYYYARGCVSSPSYLAMNLGLRRTILLFIIFKWSAIRLKSFWNSFNKCWTFAASISIMNESGRSSCWADITRSSCYEISISML